MYILGIESTAHTFGVGIITHKGEVLSNITDSYTSETIGMIPDQVATHHTKVAEKVLLKSLNKANLTWKDIKFISYSAGPGIDPVLWSGYHKAVEWSKKYNKELVGVNHCVAHLSIGKIYNKLKNPCYLYVSGVNTQVIVNEGGKYRVVGETLDIGLGNMLDKFGRIIDLGFPAGPKIEKLAKNGNYVKLPYIVKGMDVSFSGILTKVKQLYEREEATKEDLCYSIQETCFSMLAEVAERAMSNTDNKELLLVGGVGANKRLCQMLNIMCKERDSKFYKVPLNLAGDQGAMIAWEGYLKRKVNLNFDVNAHWRVDEV